MFKCLGTGVFIGLSAAVFAQNSAPCDNPTFPPSLKNVSMALGICQEIADLSASPREISAFSDPERNDLTTRRPPDLLRAQATINIATVQLSAASAELSRDAIDANNRRAASQKSLAIAAGIIGLVGGGGGGALHLVNNPQVGHAATVLGLTAGALGGSLGAYNAFKNSPPPDKNPTPRFIARYSEQQIQKQLPAIGTNPDALANVIKDLAEKIELLQYCVLDQSTCHNTTVQ